MTGKSSQAGMRGWTISLAGPGWVCSSFQGTVSVLVDINPLKMSPVELNYIGVPG